MKNGDTLESVAKQFGISVEELKRYHNTYCELKYLIGYHINGIHEILVPPSEKIAEITERHKAISQTNHLPSNYLTLQFYASNYEAAERIEQNDKEHLEINYSICINLEIADKGFSAAVKTYGFEKKGRIPDDKISMLSLACNDSISPVKFVIPAQGKISGFCDHKNLVNNFDDKRFDLESFFIGEISKTYINQFRISISNENYLLKQFRSTLLYQVLFLRMDWFNRKNEWEEIFYIIPNSFPVKCLFKTEYNFENQITVETIIKGKVIEDCSLQELLKGVKFEELQEDKLTGEIEIRYITYKQTKRLLNIEASLILYHEEEFYSKHHLTVAAIEEKPLRNLVL